MRKVPLKDFDKEGDNGYKSMIVTFLESPSNADRGTDRAEMIKVLPILTKFANLEDGADHILLEEAEYKEVSDRVLAGRFKRNSAVILQFQNDVVDSEEVEVKEK